MFLSFLLTVEHLDTMAGEVDAPSRGKSSSELFRCTNGAFGKVDVGSLVGWRSCGGEPWVDFVDFVGHCCSKWSVSYSSSDRRFSTWSLSPCIDGRAKWFRKKQGFSQEPIELNSVEVLPLVQTPKTLADHFPRSSLACWED